MKKKIKDGILAQGEATGHAHRVGADVFEENGYRKFEAVGYLVLHHEEHKEIPLPPGEYTSGTVNEYDWFEEEVRKVKD